jgi:hypothetical protein
LIPQVVSLRPPGAWHLETCGDGRKVGDYELTAIGKKRMGFDTTFTETHGRKENL